jgi:uncharacterized protein
MGCAQLIVCVNDLPAAGLERTGRIEYADLGIDADELASFPEPLSIRLRIAPVQAGILVTGELRGVLRMSCDRCLAPVDVAVADEEVCHHYPEVAEPVLDLTDDIREDILLAFPQGCLCRDDCRGLCPQCGRDLNKGVCTCADSSDLGGPWGVLDGWSAPSDEDGAAER